MNEATVTAVDQGQQPDILLVHRLFEIAEDRRVEGDVDDKGMAVVRGWASLEFVEADGASWG